MEKRIDDLTPNELREVAIGFGLDPTHPDVALNIRSAANSDVVSVRNAPLGAQASEAAEAGPLRNTPRKRGRPAQTAPGRPAQTAQTAPTWQNDIPYVPDVPAGKVRVFLPMPEDDDAEREIALSVNGRAMKVVRGVNSDLPFDYFLVLNQARKLVYRPLKDEDVGKVTRPEDLVPRMVPQYTFHVIGMSEPPRKYPKKDIGRLLQVA